MNTSDNEQVYTYSLADLGSVVTSSISQSVTSAEFRALEVANLNSWNLEDLSSILNRKKIDVNQINWIDVKRSLNQINSKRNVFIALGEQCAWVLSYDDNTQKLNGKCTDRFQEDNTKDLSDLFDKSYNEWKFVKCQKQYTDQLAVLPGVEKHWFWSTIWVNRSLYVQSGLASLLTNIFALGVSLFSMIVYNRIIPSNAMNSLLVLVSGLVLLMLVDYIVKNIRNRYLSVAGVSSDLTLADRLFAQVMDIQYRSRQGTVGSLANTLKEFEHIREFFASATLTSLIDVPFATIFLLTIWIVGGWMVIPVFAGIVILVLVTMYVQPKMKALAKSAFEDGQTKHSVLVESPTGLETLK